MEDRSIQRIIILGGYGNFGKRIAENLTRTCELTVVVSGRNLSKAQRCCAELRTTSMQGTLEAAQIDFTAPLFTEELRALTPDLLIHTGGPFQKQDYTVAKACIDVGCHYIDLADDRRFVCDFNQLNELATNRNLLLVSGASSVPGLSSTVIDHYAPRFQSLKEIDFAIAPGNRGERGIATVRGILSYTGHPFPMFLEGSWKNQYGWLSPRKLNFGETVGDRWLANVDIPDLELFPERYSTAKTVRFQAGLELPWLHHTMVYMAKLAKLGIIKDWSRFTTMIFNASEFFRPFGTDVGGMQVRMSGTDTENRPLSIRWLLSATNDIGPYIPTLSAIILTKKLIAGEIPTKGAIPCLGLYELTDFDDEIEQLDITHKVEVTIG